MFLNAIFTLFIARIVRVAWLLHKEKGGRRMRKRYRKVLRWE